MRAQGRDIPHSNSQSCGKHGGTPLEIRTWSRAGPHASGKHSDPHSDDASILNPEVCTLTDIRKPGLMPRIECGANLAVRLGLLVDTPTPAVILCAHSPACFPVANLNPTL